MNTAGLRLIGLKHALLGGGVPNLPPRQQTAEALHLRSTHLSRRIRQERLQCKGGTVEPDAHPKQTLQKAQPHKALTLRQQARENSRLLEQEVRDVTGSVYPCSSSTDLSEAHVTAHAAQSSPPEAARARIQQRLRLAYACVAVSPALTRHLVALVGVEEGDVDADTRRKLDKSFRLLRKNACATCGIIRIPGLTCQGRIRSLRSSGKARRYVRRYRKEQQGMLGSIGSMWEPGTGVLKEEKRPVACLVTRCCGCSAVSDVGPSHLNVRTGSKRGPAEDRPDDSQIQKQAVAKKRRGLSLTEKLMSQSVLTQGVDRPEVSPVKLCASAAEKQPTTRTAPPKLSEVLPLNSTASPNSLVGIDVNVSKPKSNCDPANPEILDAMLGDFIDAL